MGEGWGRGWQRDTEVHRGPGLTFIHNIVHRWSAPGMRKQKGLLRISKPYSCNLPYSARLFVLFFSKWQTENERDKDGNRQRDKAKYCCWLSEWLSMEHTE